MLRFNNTVRVLSIAYINRLTMGISHEFEKEAEFV
jgi:hypothetical protein